MSRRYIDVHAHCPLGQWDTWDPLSSLEVLDRLEIQTQILSLPHMFVTGTGRAVNAAQRARDVNERFAKAVSAKPQRFGAYATVPGDDPERAVDEMIYAVDQLRLDGICITSNSRGRYLGNPFFEPLLAEAERRLVPVFLHPCMPPHAADLALGRPPFLVEYPFDTARSITDAAFSGVFQRHPRLRLIVAHCGGALPSLAWRISHLAEFGRRSTEVVGTSDVAAAIRGLYFETALSGDPNSLKAVLDLVPPSQLLYGTDCGAAKESVIRENTDGLESYRLSEADMTLIRRGNALRLFARLSNEPGEQ